MKHFYVIKQIFFIIIIVGALSQEGCSRNKDVLKQAFKKYQGKYIIYINKHDFSLEIYDRSLTSLERYTVGYGSNPDKKPKIIRGDNRTPEGMYRISEILSIDANKSTGSYQKLHAMNSAYFKASEGHHLYGHPDKDLGYNAYGPRFYRINYPNSKDLAKYQTALETGKIVTNKGKLPGIGSGIAIHGNADEKSIGYLSSSGCIRMFNKDVVELEKYIMLGTPVIITAE